MKKIVVANWKMNKTVDQAQRWLESLVRGIEPAVLDEVQTIVCPSSVLLSEVASKISELGAKIFLGAQDVSRFEEGAHTGDIPVRQLRDLVSFCLVGHSERRRQGETEEAIRDKIRLCLENKLTPILCIESLDQLPPDRGRGLIVAYEPPEAIGSGCPDTPQSAQSIARQVREQVGFSIPVLYGGSVDSNNVAGFVSQPDIAGVLVGQASLDSGEFLRILEEVRRML